MDHQTLIFRILLSTLLGGVIGIDRQSKNKPVGVKTYSLACLGASSTAILSLELATTVTKETAHALMMDPTRIIQAVIVGIGFLGSGAILHHGRHVEGMKTGASVWIAGCIGLVTGYGFYLHALMVTLIVWGVLALGDRRPESSFARSQK